MRHQPRVHEMPWSAPVFDERRAASNPQLLCMVSAPGVGGDGTVSRDSQCRCVTEQGTLYLLDMSRCAHVARWGGTYNPYKEREQGAPQPAVVADEPVGASPAMVVGIGDEKRPVHPQGAFRGVSTGPETGYELQGW